MNSLKLILLNLLLFCSIQDSVSIWIQKADFAGPARHRCTAFTVGSRGYVGLGHVNSATHIIYQDIWEYNPATDSWSQKANYMGGQVYQCAAFTVGQYAYVGLGRDVNDLYVDDFYRFDPLANQWIQVAQFPGEPRRGAAAFVLNDLGYVGLGQSNNGYELDFFKYDPNSNSWASVANFIGAARTAPVSFTNNGLGYIGTGHTWSAALKDFYQYDPSLDQWTQLADVGDTLRQDATGFVVNGKGYIGTGNNVDGSINYGDFWVYDFSTGIWTQADDFGGFKRRFMVSFVIGNVAYCGTGTNGTNLKDFWAFDPVLSTPSLQNELNLSIYPNPVINQLNLKLESAVAGQVHIFNYAGQIVKRDIINGIETSLDLSQLQTGTYLIRLTTLTGTYTHKFIKS